METIITVTTEAGIMPKNSVSEDMGKFTAHFFRRGGAKNQFFIGKERSPLDVSKWWGGWGSSDDVNTVIKYLL